MTTVTDFKQKRSVGSAGGFFNQLMGNNASLPEVGKGATILHYSDRSAYEVLEVSDDKKDVVIRRYKYPAVSIIFGILREYYDFSF